MNAPQDAFTRAAHADAAAIMEFAAAMASKMHQAAMKGHFGWENPDLCTTESLQRALQEHVVKGDPVDVANYAMMLHARGAGSASASLQTNMLLDNLMMRAALRAVLDEVSPGCTPISIDSSLPRSLIDLVDRAANPIGA
jgi:hypothetical protein